MAFKKRRASAAPRKRRRRTTVTVGRRRTRRRSVGAVGSTHHRRRRRRVGSTMAHGSFKQILELGAGMAAGAMATHMLLRPLEEKVGQQFPMAIKMMGAAEVLLGGFIYLKGKNSLIKGAGLGIMGGGVHTVMHQFNIGKHNPAINGPGDYETVRVPISGNLNNLINGVIDDKYGPTRTSYVAGSGDMGSSSADLWNTNLVAGPEEADWLEPIGYNY